MAGVAVFTGDGSGTVTIAAQRATLLNPSQPLPGMSQRLVASRLMAPSPIPRARLFARDQTPDTKVAHPGGFGSGGDGHAPAEELDEDAEELRLPGLGTLSPPGPVVRSHAVHKRPFSFQGSAAAEHRPVQDSSSWQLLQAGGSQARSQKVTQWTQRPRMQVKSFVRLHDRYGKSSFSHPSPATAGSNLTRDPVRFSLMVSP